MKLNIYLKILISAIFLYSSIAIAQIVIVTNEFSQLNSLSKKDVGALFLGYYDIVPDGDLILPVEITGDKELMEEFHKEYTGKTLLQLKAHWNRMIFSGKSIPPKRVDTIDQAKFITERNPNVITYMRKKDVKGNLKILNVKN